LYLENKEIVLQEELDIRHRRLEGKRERLKKLEEELVQYANVVEALSEKQKECEMEKQQLWNTMSKNDFREMGRQDVNNKRQRVD
jgi:hypothetical protein